jgi:hypothetical protein
MNRPLSDLSMLGVLVGTSLLVLVSAEIGYRWARARHDKRIEKEQPVGRMAGATLGFLAFLLAFTFGVAEDSYEARRVALIQETNAIHLTYLLSSMAPPAQREEIRAVLRQYVDQRLRWVERRPDPPGNSADELLDRLWTATVAVAEQNPGNVDVFLNSVGRVIELGHERVFLREQNRIPAGFWIVVGFLTFLAASAVGYHEGVAETSRSPVRLAVALAFGAVMMVIVDLDRPGQGFIEVNQRPMLDLRATLARSPQ